MKTIYTVASSAGRDPFNWEPSREIDIRLKADPKRIVFAAYYDKSEPCCGIDGINDFVSSFDRKKLKIEAPKELAAKIEEQIKKAAGFTRCCLMRAVFRQGEFTEVLDAMVKHGGWEIVDTFRNSNTKTNLTLITKKYVGSKSKAAIPQKYEVK